MDEIQPNVTEKVAEEPKKSAAVGRNQQGRFAAGNRFGPGRPPNQMSLTAELRRQLALPCPHSDRGETWNQYLVRQWLGQAAENSSFFKELIERIEGKVADKLEADVKSDVHWVIGKGYADRNTGA